MRKAKTKGNSHHQDLRLITIVKLAYITLCREEKMPHQPFPFRILTEKEKNFNPFRPPDVRGPHQCTDGS